MGRIPSMAVEGLGQADTFDNIIRKNQSGAIGGATLPTPRPVQNGPVTVGLDGGDAVSAVGLRFGGIVTFCCSLSRLAAVQGSSLIVSLPRFVRRVERSQYHTRRKGNAGLFLATKNPPARWCSGRSRSRPFSVLAGAVSDRLKAYPTLSLVRWRLCAERGRTLCAL